MTRPYVQFEFRDVDGGISPHTITEAVDSGDSGETRARSEAVPDHASDRGIANTAVASEGHFAGLGCTVGVGRAYSPIEIPLRAAYSLKARAARDGCAKAMYESGRTR